MQAYILNDGESTVITGTTPEEIIDHWNNTFMNQVIEPGQFRQAIADRAHLWSGTEIRIDGTAEDFLTECERARLIYRVENIRVLADFVTGQTGKGSPCR